MQFVSFLLRGFMILIVGVALSKAGIGFAATCKVIGAHQPSEAEAAFLHSDYDRSVSLYRAQLQQKPGDPALTAQLAEVLLRQQKVKDADDIVRQSLTQNPHSAILTTALGELQYREGTPWLAIDSAQAAMQLDPCYPEARLLQARLLRLNSLYASAAQELSTAHALDPHNPRIRSRWLETLPRNERITALENYLGSENGEDAETIKHLHFYLDYLRQQAIAPHKPCRLISKTETANIPFTNLMRDANHIRSFGLTVKLNDHDAHLEIDTGASGLLISRSVANRAGLKQFSREEVGGVGNEGKKAAFIAFADDIKIGALEFQDCEVEVVDKGNVVDIDGVIGMDVLSHFLITLDFPVRALLLSPLPPRPNAVPSDKPTLATGGAQNEEEPASNGAAATAQATPAPHGPYDRYIAPEMKDWTRVQRIGHTLLIPASLNDSPRKMFILDTGAFATTVSPEAAREVTKVRSQDYIQVHGLNGKVDKVFTADSITFRFANIAQTVNDVVAFSTASISKDLNMEVSGLIGFTALGQMTLSIDYRDGLVKFRYVAKRGFGLPQ